MPHNYGLDNTVAARNQVPRDERVVFSRMPGAAFRVLFIGNSITLHGIAPAIGWHGRWGMAASRQENDYVHVAMRTIRERIPRAAHAILQAADWERAYESGGAFCADYRYLAEWRPDAIVLRLGENIPEDAVKPQALQAAIVDMIRFFSSGGNPQTVITGMFWPNERKDAVFQRAAQTLNADFVPLSDLGSRADMMAVGLFGHKGVAAHPGDAGMREIAGRIAEHIHPPR